MTAQSRDKIKPGRASLIGGVAVGVAVFALWLALTRDLGVVGAWPTMAGLMVASGIATWIRIADL